MHGGESLAGSEHSGWPSVAMERSKEKEFAISFDKKETKKEDLWSLSDMIREHEKNRGCSMYSTKRRLGHLETKDRHQERIVFHREIYFGPAVRPALQKTKKHLEIYTGPRRRL